MKETFSRMIGLITKQLAPVSMVALAVALPVAGVMADAPVSISANTGVANVTAGDTSYSPTIDASYDQVVKVEVQYDNTEAANSGLVASDVHVKINIPSTPGATQTVTTTTGGSNTNTINGSATVNLAQSNGYLQYIPGSAQADITNTNGTSSLVTVPDSSIESTQGYLIDNGNPCQSAAVAVEARVMVPGVKIVKQVELSTQSNDWAQTNTAEPGDTLKYLISYYNTGNTVENQVIIRDNLPPQMTLVPGTTYLADASHPSGVLVSDDVTQGGINAGNFGAGADAFVTFEVKLPAANQLSCDTTTFTNVGVVHPEGMDEFYNTAVTTVDNTDCTTPVTPVTPTPATPASQQLVNTGPGDVIGVFAATTIAGAVAHRVFKMRKLARLSK